METTLNTSERPLPPKNEAAAESMLNAGHRCGGTGSLSREEWKFRNLAEHISQIVFVVTEQGRGEYFNAYWETYTGLSEGQSFDFGWMRAFHRDDLDKLIKFRRPLEANGREFEARLRRAADGSYRRHLCRCSIAGQEAEGDWMVICCADMEDWREAEARAKEQGALLALSLRAHDEEKRKTAHGLHDSAGQYLVALQMKLDGLQRSAIGNTGSKNPIVDECRELVKRCCTEIRTISHQLYPPLLDDLGLESAVHLHVDGFIERTKTRVELEIEPNLGRLDRDLEIALFRVVQESLAAIRRQCAGKDVSIKIGAGPTSVVVAVAGSGGGSAPADKFAAWSHTPSGAGLATLRQRIVEAGGVFEIMPLPSGMAIRAEVPRRAMVAHTCD